MSRYGGRRVQRLRHLVAEAYPLVCVHCSKPLTMQTMTVEHMLPRSRGGSDDLANLRPACGRCNFGRGNRIEYRGRRSAEDATDFFDATR
ncbi:HNH endonuclease [Micrococcus luteus]|uniref:HNH endonuclease n=1 Tax=Micrococcus luteus TaxID=1270 RepID=UPI00203FCEBF|nr:HNH endonuclease [Micrococcus luteus]MCM3577439.1 HNH endonuclease [Micrococcus luteus]